MGLILFLLIPLLIAGVSLVFAADDRSEELLLLKLFGYAILGAFTFRINQFPLPIGFPIALYIANRAAVNQRARRTAATIAFVTFLISLFL